MVALPRPVLLSLHHLFWFCFLLERDGGQLCLPNLRVSGCLSWRSSENLNSWIKVSVVICAGKMDAVLSIG